jgi:folate-binding protein YgfZ
MGAALVRVPAAIVELTGSGALACLQGIVSNDVVKAGPHSLTWAGILTPKGLVITDCWIIRAAGRLFVLAPAAAHANIMEVFRRSLPPRLAQAVDRTPTWRLVLLWEGGERAAAPGRGRVELRGDLILARRDRPAWFDVAVIGPEAAASQFVAAQVGAGASEQDQGWADRRRILAGWPALGREIDDKTLVQEVRFDENGGVSYEKGCYTGQETVARLHFRGHTNRNLRGLVWDSNEALADDRVVVAGKDVGRIGSTMETPRRRLGLALVRREVEDGAQVTAGGAPATIVALPFEEAPER